MGHNSVGIWSNYVLGHQKNKDQCKIHGQAKFPYFEANVGHFPKKSPFTHDGKPKTVTPGKVENHQQDLKLLFNTSKNQLNREPAHPYEYGGLI